MFIKSLKDLIETNPGTVYVHNLSKFDSFFLIKLLYKNFNVKTVYKGRLILSLKVKQLDGSKTYKMVFKDSLLLIQGSLRKLAKTYEVETQKGVFPYKFPNNSNLNYVGLKPDYSFYNDITIEEYNEIPNNNWSVKTETEKYLCDDLFSLYQVLKKFSDIIFKSERVNITSCSTISSLAFRIYKTNYLKSNDMIYQINGRTHKNMRNAYYGGRVDVFKPFGKNINCFDVNSLYPFSMLKPMPIGKAIMSNDENLDNYFGNVYAEITTPKDINGRFIDLKYPPLPYKDEKGSLINPLGV